MSIPIYPSIEEVSISDTFNDWRNKTNKLKKHSDYIEVIFGNWSGLKTTNQDTFVGALNETYDYVVSNNESIKDLQNKQIKSFKYIGLSSDGTYVSNGQYYTKSNIIANDINALDDNLFKLQMYTNTVKVGLDTTIDNITIIKNSVGLLSDGKYLSFNGNRYANTDNVKNDINSLDLTLYNHKTEYNKKVVGTHSDAISKLDVDLNLLKLNLEDHDERMENMHQHIGLSGSDFGNDWGHYKSTATNDYAVNDNIKEDIYSLDNAIKVLSSTGLGNPPPSISVYWKDIINKPNLDFTGGSEFATGTQMLFYQSDVPLGWSLITGVNDSILRVVNHSSDGGRSEGVVSASDVFTHSHGHTLKFDAETGEHSLSLGEMPKHTHNFVDAYWPQNATDSRDDTLKRDDDRAPGGSTGIDYNNYHYYTRDAETAESGSGNGHSHTLNGVFSGSINQVKFVPKYSNVIICVKD